jgi:putative hydrolase of the HAD superfamily
MPAFPSAILLDALGTLVALEPPAPLLRGELASRFAIDVSEAQARVAFAAEISYYRAHFDEGRDRDSIARLRAECAKVLRAALPPSRALEAIKPGEFLQALVASLRFRAFADVAPALGALRGRGRRLVVVSNWDASLHDVLDRLELTPLLDGVLTSAEVGARKPAPAIFARALELAGVPAVRATHVGDSLADDVAGARAAGIEPILINRDAAPAPVGVRTIATLAELLNGD